MIITINLGLILILYLLGGLTAICLGLITNLMERNSLAIGWCFIFSWYAVLCIIGELFKITVKKILPNYKNKLSIYTYWRLYSILIEFDFKKRRALELCFRDRYRNRNKHGYCARYFTTPDYRWDNSFWDIHEFCWQSYEEMLEYYYIERYIKKVF